MNETVTKALTLAVILSCFCVLVCTGASMPSKDIGRCDIAQRESKVYTQQAGKGTAWFGILGGLLGMSAGALTMWAIFKSEQWLLFYAFGADLLVMLFLFLTFVLAVVDIAAVKEDEREFERFMFDHYQETWDCSFKPPKAWVANVFFLLLSMLLVAPATAFNYKQARDDYGPQRDVQTA